jgi:hypothetical protein
MGAGHLGGILLDGEGDFPIKKWGIPFQKRPSAGPPTTLYIYSETMNKFLVPE